MPGSQLRVGSLPALVSSVVISQHSGGTWYLQNGIQDFQPQVACGRWDRVLSPQNTWKEQGWFQDSTASASHPTVLERRESQSWVEVWVGTPPPPLPSAWDGTSYLEYNDRTSQVFSACSVAATVLTAFQTKPLNSEWHFTEEEMGFEPRISDSRTHMLNHQGSVPCSISTWQLKCRHLSVKSGKKGWVEYIWTCLGEIF